MTLDEQIQAMQIKFAEIERLKARRDAIKAMIVNLTGDYDPLSNPSSMMNPLSTFNFVLTYEQITEFSVQIIQILAVELAKTEAELAILLQ